MANYILPNGYVSGIDGPFRPASKARDGVILTHSILALPGFAAFASMVGGTWLVELSRRVTHDRWRVEATNRHLQCFARMRRVWWEELEHLRAEVTVIAFLHNRFHKRLRREQAADTFNRRMSR